MWSKSAFCRWISKVNLLTLNYLSLNRTPLESTGEFFRYLPHWKSNVSNGVKYGGVMKIINNILRACREVPYGILLNRLFKIIIFVILFFTTVINVSFAQDNYVFGPSIRVNDDPPGSSAHYIISSGQHGITCRGDTVYAVFGDDRNSDYRAVYFSKSTDAGQTWNPNIRVAGGLSNFTASWAAIDLDNQGLIYVTFQSREPGNDRNIYFIKSTDGGMSFLDSVLVNDTTRALQWRPGIAVDSSGQKVFIAWEDARNPNPPNPNYDIYFARSTDGGATFLPSIRIDDTGTDSSWQQFPSIGCTRSGDTIYVAWDDQRDGTRDVYFARSTNGGQSFEPNIIVNDTAGMIPSVQWNPSLWASMSGNIYIVWQDQTSGLKTYCDKSTDGGISFDQDILVSDSAAFPSHPSIAVDDSDYVFVAWKDARDVGTTGHDIYFSFSSDSGNTFSPDVRVNDLGGAIDAWDWDGNVTVNDSGKVFVAWDTDRNALGTTYFDIYCAAGQYVGIQEYCGPKPTVIMQCYPNPFRQTTTIKFQAPRTKNQIELKIYDVSGRLVKSFNYLTNQPFNQIIWRGQDDLDRQVSCGVYFIRLAVSPVGVIDAVGGTSDYIETKKAILLK